MMKASNIEENTKRIMCNGEILVPKLNGLWNIHKTIAPLRSAVSRNGISSHELAKHLIEFLQPFVERTESFQGTRYNLLTKLITGTYNQKTSMLVFKNWQMHPWSTQKYLK